MRKFITSLKVGQRCNVRRCGLMVRKVTKTERITRNGQRWFYWYWQPRASTPEGRVDCGYGGMVIA